MARHEGRSGCAARSGVRQEKKQSAKGLTCQKCGNVGHIRRNCHEGIAVKVRRRAPTAILFGAVDQVHAVVGRDAAVGLAAVEAVGGGRGGNQAAAGGDTSAVASSAATLCGGGAAAGSSGSYVASRIVYVGGAGNSVGSAGVDSTQTLGQAGPVSGAPSAGATAATAPSAYCLLYTSPSPRD